MTAWLLVAAIVLCTTLADVLQSWEMRRPLAVRGGLWAAVAQRPLLPVAVLFMAVSFFAFLRLLQESDLSFAVPATALSIVAETVLAKLVLREQVGPRRWLGVLLVTGGVALLA